MFKRNLCAAAVPLQVIWCGDIVADYHPICLIELCGVFVSDVLPLIPENLPDVVGDKTTTFEGL